MTGSGRVSELHCVGGGGRDVETVGEATVIGTKVL